MTLEDLIRRFRVAARDTVTPYLFSDEDVTDWLNDALEEAVIRGRLIRDDATTSVTRVPLTVGTHTYPLHESVYEIICARLIHANGEEPTTLVLKSREWLDTNMPAWRESTDPAEILIQDDTKIRVVGSFLVGDRIDLECYRLPLEPLANDPDEPEIHKAHHVHLINWALHRAFSIPDVEVFDPNRAAIAESKFTAYFGIRPDSDLRRITREDTAHSSYSVLP